MDGRLSADQLARTGASQGFPRAAAPVGVFSRGTTRISGSHSCGAREDRSPCAWRGGARKEIEENNRMGKTRDLFKKIRDTKGTFHAKMSSIKDRNGPSGEPGVSGDFWGSQEGCQVNSE